MTFPAGTNHHPSLMFEIMAVDQSKLMDFYHKVFGWEYQLGQQGFAYITFPTTVRPLLGGIGQAAPGTPGLEPGCNFYLVVDDLDATIAKAIQAGGAAFMPPTEIDGYHFAMIQDPECNAIGLLKPWER